MRRDLQAPPARHRSFYQPRPRWHSAGGVLTPPLMRNRKEGKGGKRVAAAAYRALTVSLSATFSVGLMWQKNGAKDLVPQSDRTPCVLPRGQRTAVLRSGGGGVDVGGGGGVDVGLLLLRPQRNTHTRMLQPTALNTLSPACRAAQAA
ncbi:hypothetical protein EYF80_026203 [Liparis tanakae]|uniref:Uncharacterized protein n=1 Tax=Liparis tanakae TaxID=230148 RepID=A0A4Z2HD42_9TELE|nr:hypothetical protein EYF80_026203 [Liparis tanakae]